MTKNFFLAVAFFAVIAMTAAPQNREIKVEDNPEWKSVVEKAKKAGKPIFMDCYTSWCGPCKMLARDVFTNDQVADYYNAQFVNAKYDMEKGEGPALAKKYAVTAYPTLLFIDPKTEQVIHRVVGAGPVDHIMQQARIAVDPASNLAGIKAAFEAGEKTPATIEPYMQALRKAGMSVEQNRVCVEYLSGLGLEQFLQEENWKLFESYVTDPLSSPAQAVFSNRSAFTKAFGAGKVDTKLSSTLMIAVNRFRNKEPEPVRDFDQARYDALMSMLTNVSDAAAPGCLVQLYAAGCAQQRDYLQLIEVLRSAVKYNMIQLGREQIRPVFLMTYLTKLVGRTDKQVQTQAVALINEVIAGTADMHNKASFNLIKGLLLDSYGDKAGAEAAKKEADELRKNAGPARMMPIG